VLVLRVCSGCERAVHARDGRRIVDIIIFVVWYGDPLERHCSVVGSGCPCGVRSLLNVA